MSLEKAAHWLAIMMGAIGLVKTIYDVVLEASLVALIRFGAVALVCTFLMLLLVAFRQSEQSQEMPQD